jgi:pimeloyl-ACP methyl ester carboxylesterase
MEPDNADVADGCIDVAVVMATGTRRAYVMNRISLLAPRGHSLAVTACGTGPTLFLLHGFPLDHRMWIHQLNELSGNFHVIAPDFRGFGSSTCGLDFPDYSLADLADDIEFIRRHLAGDQPISICGLSMGGYVALEYWRRHRGKLRGLVLANTKPDADTEAARQVRMEMARIAREQGTQSAVAAMLDKLLTPPSSAERASLRQHVGEIMFSIRPEAIVAAQTAMANRADFRDQLPSMNVPTLVITGEHDPLAPPAATQDWSQLIPNADYQVLAEAAHLTPLEVPEAFNERLASFLLD